MSNDGKINVFELHMATCVIGAHVYIPWYYACRFQGHLPDPAARRMLDPLSVYALSGMVTFACLFLVPRILAYFRNKTNTPNDDP